MFIYLFMIILYNLYHLATTLPPILKMTIFPFEESGFLFGGGFCGVWLFLKTNESSFDAMGQ